MTIAVGPVGRRMLRAMHLATAVLTTGGDSVVVDEMLLAPDLLASWTDALTGIEVVFATWPGGAAGRVAGLP